MLVLEYKIKAKPSQYKAIDEAIRTVQFIRNKAIRYWMDAPKDAKINRFALNKYSTELRNEFSFVKDLNSMAVQAAAERGWVAISRFYDARCSWGFPPRPHSLPKLILPGQFR